MNVKTTIPISEARRRIFDIAEEIQTPGTHYTLTEKGRPKAVLISAEEFDSLQETLEVLSDPQAIKTIRKSEEEFRHGDYITLDELMKKLNSPAAKRGAKSRRAR